MPDGTRRSAWALPAVLLVLVSAWVAWIEVSGRAFLPRHTSARDLPYALRKDGIPEQPFNRSMTDAMNLLYPDRVFATGMLRSGKLPLWNHEILCGSPHAANPLTATFYPPNLLFVWADPIDSVLYSAALHIFLAGVLFHVFLLAAGVRPWAATVGAIGFALSGWTAAHLHNTPLVAVVAWIPLGLAGIEWILGGRRKRGTFALATSVALQWLAGFSLFAVFGTLALAGYACVSLLMPGLGSAGARARTGGRILAAALLGLMIACVQILLTLDARGRSSRTGSTRAELAGDQSFEPGVLAGLALPRWLGDAHEKPVTEAPIEADQDHAARFIAARLVLGQRRNGQHIADINNFGERTIYAGAPILLLAIAGLVSLRRRAVLALLVPAVLATVFALGLLPPDAVLAALGLNVGAPGRAILVLVLVMPALAAFGLDRLFDPERPSRLAWAAIHLTGFALGSVVLLAALLAFARGEQALDAVLEFLRASGAGAALGASPDRPLSEYAAAIRPAFERLRLDLLLMSIFVAATWAVLVWARLAARRKSEPGWGLRAASVGVAAILTVDLAMFFLGVIKPVVRDRNYEPTPALDFLHAHAAEGRFARIAADRADGTAEIHNLLSPNMGMVHGLMDAQGERELVPSRLLKLVGDTTVYPSPMGFGGFALPEAKSPVLDLLGARWLIASRPLDEAAAAFASSGLTRVDLGGAESRPPSGPLRDLAVYENADALPFAFVVHEAVVMNDDDAVQALRSGTADFRRRVILASPNDGTSTGLSPAPGEIATARFEPNAIKLDVTLSEPGYVVIGTCWAPGWRATLWNGPWKEDSAEDLPVVRANAAFMAVKAPNGHYTIALRYWPPALTWGVVLAGAAGLILVLWTIWPARRRAPVPGATAS